MAEGFIDGGHVVLGCARSTEAIAELRRQHGPPHSFEVVDVSRDDEVAAWAERVLGDAAADLLVNNAGLINRNAPLWELPAGEFSQVIDVNIKGVVNVIRHFLPAMVDRRQGVIVNFSSGWGRSTAPQVAPYCATKWAIEGLTRSLAAELPSGMAAVALNPGIIDTDILRSCFGEASASYVDPTTWARRAVPFILDIGPSENGRPLSVPY